VGGLPVLLSQGRNEEGRRCPFCPLSLSDSSLVPGMHLASRSPNRRWRTSPCGWLCSESSMCYAANHCLGPGCSPGGTIDLARRADVWDRPRGAGIFGNKPSIARARRFLLSPGAVCLCSHDVPLEVEVSDSGSRLPLTDLF
jgi:hypothetical protein